MARPLDQILDKTVRIEPGMDGTFLAFVGDAHKAERDSYGFTNVTDLMTWLQHAAQAQQAAEVPEMLTMEQAVRATTGLDTLPRNIGTTMRTTALGSLADRMARAEGAAFQQPIAEADQPKFVGIGGLPYEPKGAA